MDLLDIALLIEGDSSSDGESQSQTRSSTNSAEEAAVAESLDCYKAGVPVVPPGWRLMSYTARCPTKHGIISSTARSVDLNAPVRVMRGDQNSMSVEGSATNVNDRRLEDESFFGK